jgi:hypothetical protein
VGCDGLRATFIAVAFYFEDRHGWKGLAEEALVAVGSALLLLFLFVQRRFLKDVGQIVQRAATSRPNL